MREHLNPVDDDTPMLFGKHEGTPMKDVPVEYLAWLSHQPWLHEWRGLHAYIQRCARLRTWRDQAQQPQEESAPDGYTSFDDYLRNR